MSFYVSVIVLDCASQGDQCDNETASKCGSLDEELPKLEVNDTAVNDTDPCEEGVQYGGTEDFAEDFSFSKGTDAPNVSFTKKKTSTDTA